jgi:hypothetical protein
MKSKSCWKYDDMKAGRVQDATIAFAKFREIH